MNSTAMDKWVQQAHELGLARPEALARSTRLLGELDAYLARRRSRRYHTEFDDLLSKLLPGLALVLQFLSEEGAQWEDAARPLRSQGTKMDAKTRYTRLTVHTDGAAHGNPGPAATGIHIVDGTTSQTVAAFGFKLGTTTNNEAEYYALLQAVEWLLERKELLANAIQIRFRLDSNLVVLQMQGRWRITEPRLKPLAEKVQSCLLQLPGTFTFEHIPREENTFADRLANDTLDK